MSADVPAARHVLLYEPSRADRLAADRALEIVRGLLARGYCVRRGAALEADGPQPLVVAGRFSSDGPPAQLGCHFVEMGERSAAEVVEMVERAVASGDRANQPRWKPWFPVIDQSRCTNCMQCLSFCLFDVYGVTADARITVANPANCKTDCPACSRVCPEVAIVFPKYKAGPINGEEVRAEDLRREAMKVDISALLGGDIYSLLRDRSERAKSRFSKERDDDRALKERQRCLAKLQQELSDLSVPPEVMASLPSPEQIRQKAAEARRRAQEASAQQRRDSASRE